MGRQHTTWISEENWQKLTNIPGESTSSKIGYAINHVDPDHQMWVNAKMRQLEAAKNALMRLAQCIHLLQESSHANVMPELKVLDDIVADIDWLWEASA